MLHKLSLQLDSSLYNAERYVIEADVEHLRHQLLTHQGHLTVPFRP